MPKYLNPYTDFGFKKLFGEEGSKELLIDFLNQLLPTRHQIAELNFKNVEQLPELSLERKAIFDIYCKSTKGEHFIVEMQKAKIDNFKERSVYYVTFPIREQAGKGLWNFQLAPIYFIALLDFEFNHDNTLTEAQKVREDIMLRNANGKVFYDKLQFTFLQMPLFKKQPDELVTHFDKWLYFLRNLEGFDHIPQILNEPIFQKAFHIAEIANLSQEQWQAYEQNLLDFLGMQAAIDTAKREGLEEGLEKGLEQGLEKGREEGLLATARKMLAKGYTIAEVTELTGLSETIVTSLNQVENS